MVKPRWRGILRRTHQRYNGESMTIDERLERIAERHEALSNTVELLTHDIDALRDAQRAEGKEIGDKIRALAIVAEQNEGRAAQMIAAVNSLEARAGQMMDAITRLARVADNHEGRIGDLEI
jgi:chromosome segregation ATPase